MDQSAERILFAVGEANTTMAVQIQFRGAAADFAWVLPLANVPPPESLALFPQRAFTALDANTGPTFVLPDDPACYNAWPVFAGAPGADTSADGPGGVTIHYEVEVGPYEAAVVESADPQALVTWLREHGYRVPVAMEPYISVYTTEGLKFLALKLLPGQGENDIQPLQFTLPGQTPSIPIRLTALAAEPEMGVLVFILAGQRYEGANWESVVIDDASIRWTFDYSSFFGVRTNWTALVAKGIDAVGGHGWVTELATSTTSYADQVRTQLEGGFFPQPEDQIAATTLLGLLDAHPYLTRLYARVSAEEMTIDPVFRRSDGGDVDGSHQLERYVDGEDMCPETPEPQPCDFATCGAGGECFLVGGGDAGTATEQAGCACVPGATARTTLDPTGTATVICQDLRMSFLNPGDRTDGTALPDPCAGFDCGLGHCESVNLTPTCVCDEGAVAIGSFTAEGNRVTTCVAPSTEVPSSFYLRRLPPPPAALPGGRDIAVPEPAPADAPGADAGATDNAAAGSNARGGGWCSITTVTDAAAGSGAPGVTLAALMSLLALGRRRAQTSRIQQ